MALAPLSNPPRTQGCSSCRHLCNTQHNEKIYIYIKENLNKTFCFVLIYINTPGGHLFNTQLKTYLYKKKLRQFFFLIYCISTYPVGTCLTHNENIYIKENFFYTSKYQHTRQIDLYSNYYRYIEYFLVVDICNLQFSKSPRKKNIDIPRRYCGIIISMRTRIDIEYFVLVDILYFRHQFCNITPNGCPQGQCFPPQDLRKPHNETEACGGKGESIAEPH